MANHRLIPPTQRTKSVYAAGLATLVLFGLFWKYERNLLWLASVLALPIWLPVAAGTAALRRKTLLLVAAGLTTLVVFGLSYWLSL